MLHITFMINACIWHANCNTCTTCFISYRYSVLRYELHTNLYQCDSNWTCVISANHNFVPSQWYIYLFCTHVPVRPASSTCTHDRFPVHSHLRKDASQSLNCSLSIYFSGPICAKFDDSIDRSLLPSSRAFDIKWRRQQHGPMHKPHSVVGGASKWHFCPPF